MNQFNTWSYSQWKCWSECPRKAKLMYLDKVPTPPPGEALIRGSAIHTEAERFLKNKRMKLPHNLSKLGPHFDALRRVKGMKSEETWIFDAEWKPSKNRWVKMILDVNFRSDDSVTIIDFKTGKIRFEEQQIQLGLYALGAFIKFKPNVVHTQLWYTDHGMVHKDTYTADEQPELMRVWTGRARAMCADVLFSPRPGFYCRWCPFSSTDFCEY